MNVYQKELQAMRPDDQIQDIVKKNGYNFILTAAHGYLVVTKSDVNAKLAKSICEYGYVGRHAYYLEEDCEAPEFLARIQNRPIYGQQYKLTSKKGEACIMGGNTWEESRVRS